MNNPLIKPRQDSTFIGSVDAERPLSKVSSQEAKSALDMIHGRRSISKDKEDDQDESLLKKNEDQIGPRKQEKIPGLADGQISQQTLANVLATQQVNVAKNVENITNAQNIATRSIEAKSATISPQALSHAKKENETQTLDKENRVKDIDVDEESSIGAADGSSSDGGRGSSTFSLDPLLSTQAAIHQLQSQQKNPDEDQQRKGKGLLAELIDELVDCLHVSERMRSDDWQIVIKLKSEILQGTQLHLENYGRKLSVKLVAGNKEAFDVLMQERFDLQNVLRSSIDQDVNVTMERV